MVSLRNTARALYCLPRESICKIYIYILMQLSVWSSPTKSLTLGSCTLGFTVSLPPRSQVLIFPFCFHLQREFRAEFDLYLKELIGVKF